MASTVETAIRSVVTKGITVLADYNRKRMPAPDTPNPYLTGIHAPMTEELTIEDLPVAGTIPAALDGRYLRIGPNPIAADPASHHWFIGDGMVHGLRIEGGRAHWYRNRWIRSTPVAEALGEPAAPGPRRGHGDTVNTNVLGFAGSIWGLIEAGGYPVKLGETLDTLAYDDFGGTLKGSFRAVRLSPYKSEKPNMCSSVLSPICKPSRKILSPFETVDVTPSQR